MQSEIFLAEINLDEVHLKHKSVFNGTQTRAYLGGLSACYDEVLIMGNARHLMLLVTGQSPLLLIKVLKEIVPTSAELLISSAQSAIASLISVAKGDRWKEASMMEIRGMILNASELSMEADCYGETLRRIMEAALTANARTWKKIEERHYQMVIHNPSLEPVDFSRISYN